MQVEVDATELPRKLLRSHMQFASDTGADSLVLLYPKWIPGIHAPRGPVENVAGLVPRDAQGRILTWERDWSDVYRFLVPRDGTEGEISVELTYITNQPSTNSRGIDAFGYRTLGIINWNTILLYPEGLASDDLTVEVTLILPPDWGAGSALPVKKRRGDRITFEPVSLTRLIDSPLICGEHYRQVELARTPGATYYIDIVADEARDLPAADSVLAPLGALALESEELFGPRPHFEAYHFLLAVSDQVPRLGLEHRQSSLNSAKADGFRDLDWTANGLGYLLPHEFVHAWVGKYRRPAGMVTADFHTDKNTEGLWVYEGLTQYLGNVLAARSGLASLQDFQEKMASYTAIRRRERGRQWRPLRDTAASSYILRGGSDSWGLMRRGQSYYVEGALLWLDFDARLLNSSDGAQGLDAFCQAFFGGGELDRETVGFERDDVIRALSELDAQAPWVDLIDTGVFRTQEKYAATWAQSAGYELELTAEPPASLKGRESRGKYVYLGESLGLTVKTDGIVSSVTPDGVGDEAGMFAGLKLVGVDGYQFTGERLREAVASSPETGRIQLLTLNDEKYSTYTLTYDGGPRYLHAVVRDEQVDRLAQITAARRPASTETDSR